MYVSQNNVRSIHLYTHSYAAKVKQIDGPIFLSKMTLQLTPSATVHHDNPGADPGFDRGGGGPQIMTGLKLPFWGLSFVEFWCWGLIFGGQGGARAPGPPPLGSAPVTI